MTYCYFILKQELNYFLLLFHFIPYIYLNYEKIIIQVNKQYFYILNQLFYKWNNVVFHLSHRQFDNKYSIIDLSELNQIQDFIQTMKNKFNIQSLDYQDYYRNNIQENKIYKYFTDIYSKKYIFYYNENIDLRIINYFGNEYIFNPKYNFYNQLHSYYTKWKKIKILNFCDYFKIIEHAEEIHIFDYDILYLICQLNISHIPKYYYTTNKKFNIKIDERLNDWQIIYI